MEPSALIGFALVFLVASWSFSALFSGALLLGRWRLRSAGPCAERRMASYSLVLAPLLSVAIIVVLTGYKVAGHWFGAQDHCLDHGHHLHLCLIHGGAWIGQAWAVATVAFAVALVLTRLIHGLTQMWTAHVALRRIQRVSRRLETPFGEILLAPADRPFCFVAGLLRPRIYVSTAAWERLSAEERLAMLAHERAHVEHGDVWRRVALGFLTLVGPPVFAKRALGVWRAATERLCDQRAALAVDDPGAVGGALLALGRNEQPLAIGACFAASSDNLVDRVEAVLNEESDGHATARWLGFASLVFATAAVATCVAFADPLHHALESLVGFI